MSQSQEILALAHEIDTHTNDVAARIDELIAEIGNGVSGADATSIKAKLGEVSNRLKGMGKNANNPFPPVPPFNA